MSDRNPLLFLVNSSIRLILCAQKDNRIGATTDLEILLQDSLCASGFPPLYNSKIANGRYSYSTLISLALPRDGSQLSNSSDECLLIISRLPVNRKRECFRGHDGQTLRKILEFTCRQETI